MTHRLRSSSPPRPWRVLLRLFARLPHGDALLGDLDEEFYRHIIPERGPRRARLWYRAQVLKSIPPLSYVSVRPFMNKPPVKKGPRMQSFLRLGETRAAFALRRLRSWLKQLVTRWIGARDRILFTSRREWSDPSRSKQTGRARPRRIR